MCPLLCSMEALVSTSIEAMVNVQGGLPQLTVQLTLHLLLLTVHAHNRPRCMLMLWLLLHRRTPESCHLVFHKGRRPRWGRIRKSLLSSLCPLSLCRRWTPWHSIGQMACQSVIGSQSCRTVNSTRFRPATLLSNVLSVCCICNNVILKLPPAVPQGASSLMGQGQERSSQMPLFAQQAPQVDALAVDCSDSMPTLPAWLSVLSHSRLNQIKIWRHHVRCASLYAAPCNYVILKTNIYLWSK